MIEARIGHAVMAFAREITLNEHGLRASVGFYSPTSEIIPPVPRNIPLTPELQMACKTLTELVEAAVAAMVGATTTTSPPQQETIRLEPAPTLAAKAGDAVWQEGGEGTLQSFLGENL